MKRHAPAAARNQAVILDQLRQQLPVSGTVLEIASGSGQHIVAFATAMPDLQWQPSDKDETALASIEAYRAEARLPNLLPPLRLDTSAWQWRPQTPLQAMLCINMIHIAPWESCLGLMVAAGRLLEPRGLLVLYGPYRFHGRFTAPSNATFDAGLRHQDPAWGVRDIDDVDAAALASGLSRAATIDMPANNHLLLYQRSV